MTPNKFACAVLTLCVVSIYGSPELFHHRTRRDVWKYGACYVKLRSTASCEEDRTPPELTCHDIQNHTIPSGQRSVMVTWEKPSAHDPESGVKSIQQIVGPLNGATLEKGAYQVVYEAENNDDRKSAACIRNFQVILIECGFPVSPNRGTVSCTYGEGKPAFGDTCTWTCEPGYNLLGDAVQTCGEDGQLGNGNGAVDCERIQCSKPLLLDNMNITECTNGFYFESTCAIGCAEGYGLPTGVTNTLQCGANKDWIGDLDICKDVEPPVFDTCPDTMTVFTERGEKYGITTWETPTASDPQGGPVQVSLTLGRESGSQFQLEPTNVHTIVYSAIDSEANEAEQCLFNVIVQERVCPPYPYSERLNVTCYGDLSWGSHCDLECDRGYPLNGSSTVYCEETADGTGVDWNWSTGKPFCQVFSCPDLNEPVNGALACGTWTHGPYCQMSCNDKYDIPRTVAISGEWTCDDTKGTWNPGTLVPGCTVLRRPGSMFLPNELFYFSGDCSDPATQDQIKNNFIEQLSHSRYATLCTEYEECIAENVEVSCGSVSTGRKKKKSTYTHKTRVDFYFKMKVIYPNGFTTDGIDSFLGTIDEKFNTMAQTFSEDVSNGIMDLSVPGLDTEADIGSYQYGWSEMICPSGMKAKWNTFSCSSCPTGTMYNATLDDCEPCPIGTYQDEDGQLSCKACPEFTSTVNTGSISLDQCIDMCIYGHYSENGLADCAQCPIGTYQSTRGASSCNACPTDTTTLATGSTHIELCLTNEQIQDFGLCNLKRCNGGFCLKDTDAGIHCVCHGGYSGEFCEIPPDPCINNLCQHGGSCVPNQIAYTCTCTEGYTGNYCQEKIINGEYTVWASWTGCSVTCGPGSRTRERECVNPPPGPGGLPCQGEALETQMCNNQDCPECEPIRFPYGHTTVCAEVGMEQVCEMTCRDGMVLFPGEEPSVKCGPFTNFTWVYSYDEPVTELPKCTSTRMPGKVTLSIELEQSEISCEQSVDPSIVQPYIDNFTNCSGMSICKTSYSTDCKSNAERRKRETGHVAIVIQLTGSITNPDYFPGGVYDSGIATTANSEFEAIIYQMYYLIQALEDALSAGTLYISADGQNYIPEMFYDAIMDCPQGMIPSDGHCMTCPAGSYQNGENCDLCELGYYQDGDGMTECTSCPVGLTTSGEGSETSTKCSITLICPVGTFQNGGRCVLCEQGYYQGQESQGHCKSCPVGYTTYTVGAEAIDECSLIVTCPPGTYNTADGCVPCAVGYYQEQEGLTYCTQCPLGLTTTDLGADNVAKCSVTVRCPPGSYQSGGKCEFCEQGYYQEHEGMTECTLCPTGYTTKHIGAETVDECSVPDTNVDPRPPSNNVTHTQPNTNERTTSHYGGTDITQHDKGDGFKDILWPIIGGIGGFILLIVLVIGVVIWKVKKSSNTRVQTIAVEENGVIDIPSKGGAASSEFLQRYITPPPPYETPRHNDIQHTHNTLDNSLVFDNKMYSNDSEYLTSNEFEKQRIPDQMECGQTPRTTRDISFENPMNLRQGSIASLGTPGAINDTFSQVN